ncbi:MAG: hypothetical protein WB808_02415 [Candidatus Dormiibacterota bacterium]
MRGRVQYLTVFGLLLLAWAALSFWAGLGFALVASLLLLAVLVPVALIAGHRFVNRPYVLVEIAALVIAVVVSAVTGFVIAGIAIGALLGVDTLICSALVLMHGRGGLRNVTRNLLVILATLGVATGASALTAALVPVPSCGTAAVGIGGATSAASAEAAQCFAASAEACIPKTLTVRDTGVDELAVHRFRIVPDIDARCHFTDAVAYGPPAAPSLHTLTYSCPTLTDLVGAPGEQQIELAQCSSSVASGLAAPIIPLNEYQPLPTPTPSPG